MNLVEIPLNTLYEILWAIPPDKFPDVCAVSSIFNAVCGDEYFWRQKALLDFPVTRRVVGKEIPFPPGVTTYRGLYAQLAIGNIRYFPLTYDPDSVMEEGEMYNYWPGNVRAGIWLEKSDTPSEIYAKIVRLVVRFEPHPLSEAEIEDIIKNNNYAINGVLEYYSIRIFGTDNEKHLELMSLIKVENSLVWDDILYWHVGMGLEGYYHRVKIIHKNNLLADLWFNHLIISDVIHDIVEVYPEAQTVTFGYYDREALLPPPIIWSSEVVRVEGSHDDERNIKRLVGLPNYHYRTFTFAAEINKDM